MSGDDEKPKLGDGCFDNADASSGGKPGQKTKPFDVAKYFPDAQAQIDLITDAFAEGHAGYIAAAIVAVAKARGLRLEVTACEQEAEQA